MTAIENLLKVASRRGLCKVLAIQDQTLCRLEQGQYQAPEITNEIERRLQAAGLLIDLRQDS